MNMTKRRHLLKSVFFDVSICSVLAGLAEFEADKRHKDLQYALSLFDDRDIYKITVDEIAITRISSATIYRAVKEREIPSDCW